MNQYTMNICQEPGCRRNAQPGETNCPACGGKYPVTWASRTYTVLTIAADVLFLSIFVIPLSMLGLSGLGVPLHWTMIITAVIVVVVYWAICAIRRRPHKPRRWWLHKVIMEKRRRRREQ